MRYYSDNSIAAIVPMRLIENTSWKVLAYGIYTRVVDVSAQRTSEISDTKTTSG